MYKTIKIYIYVSSKTGEKLNSILQDFNLFHVF